MNTSLKCNTGNSFNLSDYQMCGMSGNGRAGKVRNVAIGNDGVIFEMIRVSTEARPEDQSEYWLLPASRAKEIDCFCQYRIHAL